VTAIPDVIEPESYQEPEFYEAHESSFADMIERLFYQFEARLPLTTIVAVVRDARQQLRGSPMAALPELTERLAIERLTTLAETAAAAD
jgi:hypothetical protein